MKTISSRVTPLRPRVCTGDPHCHVRIRRQMGGSSPYRHHGDQLQPFQAEVVVRLCGKNHAQPTCLTAECDKQEECSPLAGS